MGNKLNIGFATLTHSDSKTISLWDEENERGLLVDLENSPTCEIQNLVTRIVDVLANRCPHDRKNPK